MHLLFIWCVQVSLLLPSFPAVSIRLPATGSTSRCNPVLELLPCGCVPPPTSQVKPQSVQTPCSLCNNGLILYIRPPNSILESRWTFVCDVVKFPPGVYRYIHLYLIHKNVTDVRLGVTLTFDHHNLTTSSLSPREYFLPKLTQFPQGVAETTHSREWNGTTRNHEASVTGAGA